MRFLKGSMAEEVVGKELGEMDDSDYRKLLDTASTDRLNDEVEYSYMAERVIESVTCEVAGRGNCVQQRPNPAKRNFCRRLLECRGDRDSTAV